MDIVRFKGGLGNQMFQYAFVEALRSRGREVKISLGFYANHLDLVPFVLDKVFINAYLPEIEEEFFAQIDFRWKRIKQSRVLLEEYRKNIEDRFFYVEENDCVYDERVFQTKNCVFVGYWQTEKYFCKIRDSLLHIFRFAYGERKLEKLRTDFLSDTRYVGVHVRRGDYLENYDLWGNLGESNYYQNAILFMENQVPNLKLVFFSDDIQWVKMNLRYEEAIYIESNMFDHYMPWYDMDLMSCCAHNIIANSSFSWWAAWLNQNKEKIVIAPEKWFFDGRDQQDICPDDWIRLKCR